MNTCEEFHYLIFFTGASCPLCELMQERDSVLAERDEKVAELSARIEELLDERDALRTELRL